MQGNLFVITFAKILVIIYSPMSTMMLCQSDMSFTRSTALARLVLTLLEPALLSPIRDLGPGTVHARGIYKVPFQLVK